MEHISCTYAEGSIRHCSLLQPTYYREGVLGLAQMWPPFPPKCTPCREAAGGDSLPSHSWKVFSSLPSSPACFLNHSAKGEPAYSGKGGGEGEELALWWFPLSSKRCPMQGRGSGASLPSPSGNGSLPSLPSPLILLLAKAVLLSAS